MKAIWTSCARALSLSRNEKRGRENDELDSTVIPDLKRAKVGRTRKVKVEIGCQVDATHRDPIIIQPKATQKKKIPEGHSKSPRPKFEEEEGIFSSLPLTYFSPSIPLTLIHQYTKNGGLALPQLGPMELSFYFKSPLTEAHPFYQVDLVFVTGPADLLGTVLRGRVLVMFDCAWVGKCIEEGKLVDLARYVVDFPIKSEEEIEGRKKEVGRVNSPIHHCIPVDATRRAISNDPSGPPNLKDFELNEHLLKYPRRTVNHSAFTSESALREASFNQPTSMPDSRHQGLTVPLRPSDPASNAAGGPSNLQECSEIPDIFKDAFIPFDLSSQPVSSDQSSPPPQLHIPYKKLDLVKARQLKTILERHPVFCELEEAYTVLIQCEKGDKMIMGLEAGLLR